MLGIHPGPFTLRELVDMVTARRRNEWDHTAAILALTAEVHRDRKRRRRPFRVHHFHPMAEPAERRRRSGGGGGVEVTADNIKTLAEAIVGRPRPD